MWSPETIDALKKYNFILGSSSPRRAEILASNVGVPKFEIVTSTFEEDLSKANITDVEYVTQTAQHKLPSIVAQLDPSKKYVLLVADTIVSCEGEILEKPGTPENSWAMLSHYRTHPSDIRVITAVHVCLVAGGKVTRHEKDHQETALQFDRTLTDQQLRYYIDTKEGLDVAGGFKYQRKGSMLFEGINGDFFNVVGLPVKKTHDLLMKIL
ncbi:hypothetical protein OXX69_003119 [Metschnikowia pulcherrima]